MSTTTTLRTPQGNLPAIGIPDVQDYPRLVFTAPYFEQVALAEVLDPAVQEAVEGMLPTLVPPFVQAAADQAVQQNAVLLVGSTMTGPLFLNPTMPTAPSQAASMAYVDSLIATAGVPEVPPVPAGQLWARETGQWSPITPQTGVYLPLTGGNMQGAIQMSGNSINGLAAIPTMPYGAAPAQWVLNQIASLSLYQGTWDVDTYTPDLTLPQFHINGFMWIAVTTTTGVVVSPPIPGLQGLTVRNGDSVLFSAAQGVFQLISGSGLTMPEAEAIFLQLAGGQMQGALLLNANPTQPMQAANMSWVESLLTGAGIPDAPGDGQLYGRNGNAHVWLPTVPLAGGLMTGQLLLFGNATQPTGAVPLQQLNSTLGAYVPIVGNVTMTGPLTFTGISSNITLNSNANAPLQPVALQQMQSTLASYLTIAVGLPLVSLNPPVAPVPGQMWLNTADMQTFIYTGSQWIVAVNPPIPSLAGYAQLAGAAFTGTVTIPGVTNGSSAAAGQVGEVIATVWTTAPVAAANTPQMLVSITLTAGDWDISGSGRLFISGAGTTTFSLGAFAIATTNATAPVAGIGYVGFNSQTTPLADMTLGIGTFRMNVSGTTPIFLNGVVNVQGTGGVIDMSGYIMARRMR